MLMCESLCSNVSVCIFSFLCLVIVIQLSPAPAPSQRAGIIQSITLSATALLLLAPTFPSLYWQFSCIHVWISMNLLLIHLSIWCTKIVTQSHKKHLSDALNLNKNLYNLSELCVQE